MEHIVGFPTDITGVFSGNVIFLRGANSDYVKPEHHPIIFKLFPNAKVTSIPDSGHWVHAENPREFLRALKEFLGSN
jgi:pimeloyl-ACP methyl ester carboxylesterase